MHTAREPPVLPTIPNLTWSLPEEDQVLLLLMVPKEMDQLIEFLICLTYLQGGGKSHICKNNPITVFSSSLFFLPIFLGGQGLT